MNVVIFGATGMVGQGLLRECLLDSGVSRVVVIVRSPSGRQHEKLREIVHADFFDFSPIASELSNLDACFFCLGVSSLGMTEPQYERVTLDITMAAAKTLSRLDPGMTFVYVSAVGADSIERGGTMWARVRGKTENALLAMPFKATYIFRPALIQPMHGITSRTKLYQLFYSLGRPLLPFLTAALPNQVTTTERFGRAMLAVARQGEAKKILMTADINRLGKA